MIPSHDICIIPGIHKMQKNVNQVTQLVSATTPHIPWYEVRLVITCWQYVQQLVQHQQFTD